MTIERKKTSYMISKVLSLELAEMSRVLGVGKSDLVSMGIALALVQFAPLQRTPMKRHMLRRKVSEEFQKICAEAEEKL
jgi:hypothetical protein